LLHRDYYYFTFGQFFSSCSPGIERSEEDLVVSGWTEQLQQCADWLSRLKEELETPDLWGLAGQATQLVEATVENSINNTPFTPKEQHYIAQQLQNIQLYLLETQQINEEQATFIKKRLQYLEDSSKRSSRVDWLNQMLGVVFSIIISAAFAPEQAREILHFFVNAFYHLVKTIRALH
jgi:hypothetical protein